MVLVVFISITAVAFYMSDQWDAIALATFFLVLNAFKVQEILSVSTFHLCHIAVFRIRSFGSGYFLLFCTILIQHWGCRSGLVRKLSQQLGFLLFGYFGLLNHLDHLDHLSYKSLDVGNGLKKWAYSLN